MPNLTSLDLTGCVTEFATEFSDVMCPYLQRLTSFKIDNNQSLTDVGIKVMTNLTHLCIHNVNRVTTEGLATMTQLIYLNMYNMHSVMDELFTTVNQLEVLISTFGRFSHQGISKLKKLKTLHLNTCTWMYSLRGFENLPDLREIKLIQCPIQDEYLQHIPHIQSLMMYGMTMSGKGLHFLHNIQHLSMHYIGLMDEYMNDVLNLSNLTSLHIYKCTVTPQKKDELKCSLGDIFHTD